MSEPKHAVCLFIQDSEGRILVVSRKDNHADFGLPGGKVDPADFSFLSQDMLPLERGVDEMDLEGAKKRAACREGSEELDGVEIDEADLTRVFTAMDGPVYLCTTFRVVGASRDRLLRIEPHVNSEGAFVTWLPPSHLMTNNNSFCVYNSALLAWIH